MDAQVICKSVFSPILLLLPSNHVSQIGSVTWCLLIILSFQNRTLSTSLLFCHKWQEHYPSCHSDSVTQGYFSLFPHASYILARTSTWHLIFPFSISDMFFFFHASDKFIIWNFLTQSSLLEFIWFFLICWLANQSLSPFEQSIVWIPSFSLLALLYLLFCIFLKASCLKLKLLFITHKFLHGCFPNVVSSLLVDWEGVGNGQWSQMK